MSENILDAREAEEQEERERQIGAEYFAKVPHKDFCDSIVGAPCDCLNAAWRSINANNQDA